jgi:F0F1-type ATP synthase assembly protein I
MVKSHAAPQSTPPSSNAKDSTSGSERPSFAKPSFEMTMYQRNVFMNMALNMTWQLALVVIIPIIGGFKLDSALNSSPWFTVLGFVIAAVGTMLVLKRIVSVANNKAAEGPKA